MTFLVSMFVLGGLILIAFVSMFVKVSAEERRRNRPAPSLPQPKRRALPSRESKRLLAAREVLAHPSPDAEALLGGVYVAPTYAERGEMLDALIAHHPDAPETARAAVAALDPDATGDGAEELTRRAFEWVAARHGAGDAMDDLMSRANLYTREPELFTRALELGVASPDEVAPAFLRLGLQHGDAHVALFTAYATRVSGDVLARDIEAIVQTHFMYDHVAARSRAFLLVSSELSSYTPERILGLVVAVDSEHLETLTDVLLSNAPPEWIVDVLIDAVATLPTHLTAKLVDRLDEFATLEHVPRLTKLARTSRLAPLRDALEDAIRSVRRRHDDGTNGGMLTILGDSQLGGLSPAHGARPGDLSGSDVRDE